MQTIHPRALALAALVFSASSALGAQPVRPPAVLSLPDGRVVEVLGLRRWTLGMLQDSLARYAPRDSLHQRRCALTLREKLGFADATATIVEDADRPPRIVLVVREPQDSARVRFRRLRSDTTPGQPEWRPFTTLIQAHPAALWRTASAFVEDDSTAPGRLASADRDAARSALAFLRSRTAERDRRAAVRTLRESANELDRAAAALTLRNFADRDDTWRALMQAMREPDGYVKSAASLVLQRLPDRSSRPVDWGPVSEDVHAILDGTSLGVTSTVLQVLRKSGVRPAQAHAFLRGGGEMVLTYLASGTPMYAYSAHDLLVKLRGADLGKAPEPWRAWIATL